MTAAEDLEGYAYSVAGPDGAPAFECRACETVLEAGDRALAAFMRDHSTRRYPGDDPTWVHRTTVCMAHDADQLLEEPGEGEEIAVVSGALVEREWEQDAYDVSRSGFLLALVDVSKVAYADNLDPFTPEPDRPDPSTKSGRERSR